MHVRFQTEKESFGTVRSSRKGGKGISLGRVDSRSRAQSFTSLSFKAGFFGLNRVKILKAISWYWSLRACQSAGTSADKILKFEGSGNISVCICKCFLLQIICMNIDLNCTEFITEKSSCPAPKRPFCWSTGSSSVILVRDSARHDWFPLTPNFILFWYSKCTIPTSIRSCSPSTDWGKCTSHWIQIQCNLSQCAWSK